MRDPYRRKCISGRRSRVEGELAGLFVEIGYLRECERVSRVVTACSIAHPLTPIDTLAIEPFLRLSSTAFCQ